MLPPTRETSARTALTVALLGLVLLSFALRIYQLDGQSLWGDEAWSLFHATRESASNVLESVSNEGTMPPGYYLALYLWISVAGQTEFAIRFLSLLWGVLTVPALFILGRRLGGRGLGLLAALLQTPSPFHVYYSQEARMYAQMTLFTVLSVYFFWRLLAEAKSGVWWTWAGYVATSALAIYSHYFAGFVVLAQALFWLGTLIWRWRTGWRAALHCLAGQAAALLLFLPWAIRVWRRVAGLSGTVERMSTPLSVILRRCLSIFSAGVPIITSAPEEPGWSVLIPFLLLLVLALLWPWKRRSLVLLVTCLSVPILATSFVSFPLLPGWTRYFIAASPPYYLLLARGADGLRQFALSGSLAAKRRVGQAGLAAVLVMPLSLAQVHSLYRYYTNPAYWHWDYRGQMAMMAEAVENGAAVVLNGRDESFLIKYYFPSDTSSFVVPSVCDQDEGGIRDEIAAIAASHEQIWLVREMPMYCDHNQRAAQWLKEHAYQVSETWLENTTFDLYSTPARMRDYQVPAQSVPVIFDDRFELLAYALGQDHVAPGDTLAVALRWRVLSSMDVDYKFFLVLLGPNDEIFSLRDGMPLNWLRPTTLWEVGEIEDDRWGMAVRADTPIGTYPLYVGAYDPTTGERLPVQTPDGEFVSDMMLVTEIEVR